MHEWRIELTGFLFLDADVDLDPGATQHPDSPSGEGIRIERRDHDTVDTRRDHCGSAWRPLSLMRAGLECHVERRAARSFACRAKRDGLGVLRAITRMEPLAHDLAIADDD